MTHLISYTLRNAADPGEVYADEIPDEAGAVARASELANFYRTTVEVCRAALGQPVERVALVDPGPVAPAPLTEPKA
ncbi:MAG TPA: hypothetical protein VFH74_01365 [Gaiellales bacterium]|nr:hypothetical protein [Gaiellales bacterium]